MAPLLGRVGLRMLSRHWQVRLRERLALARVIWPEIQLFRRWRELPVAHQEAG